MTITYATKLASVKPAHVANFCRCSPGVILNALSSEPFKFRRFDSKEREVICYDWTQLVRCPDGDICVFADENSIDIYELVKESETDIYMSLTDEKVELHERFCRHLSRRLLFSMLLHRKTHVVFTDSLRVLASMESVCPSVEEMIKGIDSIEHLYPADIISVSRDGNGIRVKDSDGVVHCLDDIYFRNDTDRAVFQRNLLDRIAA